MRKIEVKYLELFITTHCSLRCKQCVSCIPYNKKPEHFDKAQIIREIKAIFNTHDYIHRFQLMGGEPFLHPDLHIFINEIFKYSNKIGALRFISNGTVLPDPRFWDVLDDNKGKIPVIDCLISDYGSLSKKKNELEKLILSNGIMLRVDKYYGENQYYNGWVDYGRFEKSTLSDEEVEQHFQICPSHCRQVYKGIIYYCSHIIGGELSGLFPAYPNGGYLDLLDENMSNEAKRDILQDIDKKAPLTCYYCIVDHDASPRFSAAEQI